MSTYVWAAAVEQTPLASVARNAAYTVFPGTASAGLGPAIPSPRALALEKSAFPIGSLKVASSPRGGEPTSPLRVSVGGGSPDTAGGVGAAAVTSAGRSIVVARRATDAADQLAHLRRHLTPLLALLFPPAAGQPPAADVDAVLSLLLRTAPSAGGAGSASSRGSVLEALRGRVAAGATAAALSAAVLDAIDLLPGAYPLAAAAPGVLHHHEPAVEGPTLVHIPGAKKEGVLRAAEPRTGAPLPYALVEDATDSTVILALATGCVDVVGCARSTIILGPAALHVTVDGCDGCTVVAAAAHVTVHNCTDTTLLLWAEHRPLLLGDNRRLRLGPYAARYRGLAAQCVAARLRGAQAAVAAGSGRETLTAALQLAQLGGRAAAARRGAGTPIPPCSLLEAALSCNFWARPIEVRFSEPHGAPAAAAGAATGAAAASEETDVTGQTSPVRAWEAAVPPASATVYSSDDLDADPVRIAELLGRCGMRDSWSILPPSLFAWKAAPSSGPAPPAGGARPAASLSAADAVLAASSDGGAAAGMPAAAAARGGAVIAVTRGDGATADMLLAPLSQHDAERQHLALPWPFAAELDARSAAEQRLRKRIDDVLSELGPEAAGRLQAAVQAAFAVSCGRSGSFLSAAHSLLSLSCAPQESLAVSDGGRTVKHLLDSLRSHERPPQHQQQPPPQPFTLLAPPPAR